MSSRPRVSPDPITLASSPPGGRFDRINDVSRASQRRSSRASTARFYTPYDDREQSPWPVHATVEVDASELNSSPEKTITQSITIPLYDAQFSSPTKRRYRKTPGLDDGIQIRRPARKRGRGTTLEKIEGSPSRIDEQVEVGEENHASNHDWSGNIHSEERRGERLQSEGRLTRRLSHAREELGRALRDATITLQPAIELRDQRRLSPSKSIAGDLTVSMNEDFTMVSMNSLQSYKDRIRSNRTAERETIVEAEEDPDIVGAFPADAPDDEMGNFDDFIQYPDLTAELAKSAHAEDALPDVQPVHDVADRKPIDSAQVHVEISQGENVQTTDQAWNEPTEWMLERQAVSRQIENASASQIIVINDTTIADENVDYGPINDEETPATTAEADDGDIWQEEASRSFQEERHDRKRSFRKRAAEDIDPPEARSPRLEDLFADEIVRPRRAKIPRTWRRTSGMDFSYSDSPDRPQRQEESNSVVGQSPTKRRLSDHGSRESGVITPPSTDDGKLRLLQSRHEPDMIDLTEPDAAATQLAARSQDEDGDDLSRTELEEGPVEMDLFEDLLENPPFHYLNSRPSRFRRRAADLSDILPDDQIRIEAATGMATKVIGEEEGTFDGDEDGEQQDEEIGDELIEDEANPGGTAQHRRTINFEPFIPKLSPRRSSPFSSPGRRSLFRPSYIRGSPIRNRRDSTNYFINDEEDSDGVDSELEPSADELQKDLLVRNTGDHVVAEIQPSRERVAHDAGVEAIQQESQQIDVTPSYQEFLNIDSPTKVKVNFNDSFDGPSRLTPRRTYPPLFDRSVGEPTREAEETQQQQLQQKEETCKTSQPGFISRVGSMLWDAIIRPSGPSEIFPSTNIDPKAELEPDFSPSLRAQIRNRYGVVSKIHTWNMVHMRTLHRMVNSITSGKSDSIIPRRGPLPSYLSCLLNTKQQSVAGFEYVFDMQNAQIVFAFLQIMVDPSLVAAMEEGEIAFLGDRNARRYRKTDVLGRRGKDSPWPHAKYKIAVPDEGTLIDAPFVVKALGDAIYAHDWELRQRAQRASAKV